MAEQEKKFAQKFDATSFDPEQFVGVLSTEGGEDELEVARKRIQGLADSTALSLKKNVYKNYIQFIDTAKEISILEGEMYQLSQMLSEQKSLMSTMIDMPITGDAGDSKDKDSEKPVIEEDTRKNLAFVLEKVQGCSGVTEVPSRHLIHNGDLVEIDPETFVQIQRVHAFLLNDSLMIASWLPHRRGPVRYKFQALYELDSLAVVNTRDAGPIKHAFKILMFPDSKMYQTDSPKEKRQWIDILEQTKRHKTALDTQKRESALLLQRQTVFDPTNPFAEEEEPANLGADLEGDVFLSVAWLQDCPEDLDVCIAQRDFEGAVDIVERIDEHLTDLPSTPAIKEYKIRIDHRVKQLTEALTTELQVSPERSLRGGPRGARKAVTQLIRLGKSSQACELFLAGKSAIIKYNIRQLKFEGSTALYIKKLCNMFFATLMDTGKEFIKAFPEHFACFSAFIIWSKTELDVFSGIFLRQVFASKMSLSTVAECVHVVREQCDKLGEIGLELSFELNHKLFEDVERAIKESRDQLIEACKLRCKEEKWQPMNLQNKSGTSKFVNEIKDTSGLDLSKLVFDECKIRLTENTLQFCKSFLSFVEDAMKLHIGEMHDLISDSIVDAFKAQQNVLENSLKRKKYIPEHQFILENAKYVLENVTTLAVQYYQERLGEPFKPFLYIQQQDMKRLKRISEQVQLQQSQQTSQHVGALV